MSGHHVETLSVGRWYRQRQVIAYTRALLRCYITDIYPNPDPMDAHLYIIRHTFYVMCYMVLCILNL